MSGSVAITPCLLKFQALFTFIGKSGTETNQTAQSVFPMTGNGWQYCRFQKTTKKHRIYHLVSLQKWAVSRSSLFEKAWETFHLRTKQSLQYRLHTNMKRLITAPINSRTSFPLVKQDHFVGSENRLMIGSRFCAVCAGHKDLSVMMQPVKDECEGKSAFSGINAMARRTISFAVLAFACKL